MKKLNTVLIIALVLSVAVIGGLSIEDQFGKFSQHKWYEGHAEDVGGIDAVLFHKIGIPADQQFCLSTACTGNHPEISFGCRHSF